MGDPGRLRQIVVNLVGNAIKFTQTGEVVVDVQLDDTVTAPGTTHLHFSVRDTGVGIPKDKHELVFNLFSQVDSSTTRRFGGTGLGLAISSQLTDLMGGRIWVDSEPGMGSTFHFTAAFGLSDRRSAEAELELPALHGLQVLVVDDHDTNRQILEEMLRSWNMRPRASPVDRRRWARAIDAGNSDDLRREAHTLKGSADLFAATRTVEAAHRLEIIGRDGELADAEAAWLQLCREVEALLPALRRKHEDV